jgi:hypothetical protein
MAARRSEERGFLRLVVAEKENQDSLEECKVLGQFVG